MSDSKIVFSSLPYQNFGIGAFVFTRGRLELDEAEAETFRKLLTTCDPITRSKVQEMPREQFDKLASENLQPAANRNNDSSSGLIPPKVAIGTTAITAGLAKPVQQLAGADAGAGAGTDSQGAN